MFGRRKRERMVDSLIGHATEIKGDIIFSGGLHIDGTVRGNISAVEGSDSVLTLSEQGVIEGDIRVPDIILNGRISGDVYGSQHIELAPNARINGNVYYNLIEMAIGAEVNGSLVHTKEPPKAAGAKDGEGKKSKSKAIAPIDDAKNSATESGA